MLHIHSCFAVEERLAYTSCHIRLPTYLKFYAAPLTLTILSPPKKVKFNDSRCHALMYSVIVYAVWFSERLDDHINIFQCRQHRERQNKHSGKRCFIRPWSRTDFRVISPQKKKKKKTTHKVSRNQNHMWTKGAESGHQKKSAVLTTRSISLDTFFHHSVCFQENDRR